jgi:lantibiotic modifying enzyme
MHNLCGFAHGAAGIGLALAELFGATGDKRFRRAGEGAFAYERSWMRPETATWPDLRGVARAAGREAPAPVSTSWCHGAPGIALSRIRAAGVLGADQAQAELGITATRRITSELLVYCPDDFCLCHGAAGAADVLVYAADRSTLAEDVGLLGIEQFHRRERGFPCGLPDGQTPSLMLGLAGVAAFYLRLGDRSVPSPLLIQPLGDLDQPPKPA